MEDGFFANYFSGVGYITKKKKKKKFATISITSSKTWNSGAKTVFKFCISQSSFTLSETLTRNADHV